MERVYKYSFEKLEVWKQSIDLVKYLYPLCNSFPSNEHYGLISQIKRASISVSANIAEGTTRGSYKDQSRFYEIAFGSLIEVLNHLIIAKELDYINDEELNNLRLQIENISRQLNALKKTQLSKCT